MLKVICFVIYFLTTHENGFVTYHGVGVKFFLEFLENFEIVCFQPSFSKILGKRHTYLGKSIFDNLRDFLQKFRTFTQIGICSRVLCPTSLQGFHSGNKNSENHEK